MRGIAPGPAVPAFPSRRWQGRWHDVYEQPQGERELEIDPGDFRVRRGVRYSRKIERFVDASGTVVPVLMWRYLDAQP